MPRLQRRAAWADDYNVESPRALPTGVVTFLLTDIEGSTRLWEREPEAMREALARHDALMLGYVRRLDGHVVKSKGEGDSVFAVFRHARHAVAAALILQCALADERWATSSPIHVRMAIHTGQVELRDGDYYGPTVNRCARLRALARGGQVIVSGASAQLTRSQLPPGATLDDLGTQRLKDLSAPEQVWQLSHPNLASEASPAVEAPSAPGRRVYKLTDHLNRTPDGRQWGERVTHTSTGLSLDEQDDSIRCYGSPTVAALMNPLYDRFHLPRLWLAHPEELMAANAARAATHASKLSWLVGRARDQGNTAAIGLASEAVRTALRITRLDLIALAEQAMPRSASPVPAVRPAAATLNRNRILRALPT